MTVTTARELEKYAKDIYFLIKDLMNDFAISFDEAAKVVEIATIILSSSRR